MVEIQFAEFNSSEIKLPELTKLDEKTPEIEDLDDMIQDVHDLKEAYLYTRNAMDKARALQRKVPQNSNKGGSLVNTQQALEDIVKGWDDFVKGPRTIGQEALDSFQEKYGDTDEEFSDLYREKLDKAIEKIQEDHDDGDQKNELNRIISELSTKYKYHHKAGIQTFENLLAMEEAFRQNTVDNVLNRLYQRLQMARQGKKGISRVLEEAEMSVDALEKVAPEAKSLEKIAAKMEEMSLVAWAMQRDYAQDLSC